MGVIQDRVLPRLREAAEERLGLTVVPRERLDSLEEAFTQFEAFRDEATELAYHSLDYFGGRPQEMRPERRKRLAQRSRIALTEDPLAGAEADLLANFSFGKGVAMPDANDEEVQKAIEDAWTDSVNVQKLTGYEAQRHRSHQLITQANLYPTAFIRNGQIRIGFLQADRVVDIICDPEDDERPLWYIYEEPPRQEFDFAEKRWKLRGEGTKDQLAITGDPRQIRFYPHWRNVEDARREREENGEPPLEEPAKEEQGQGLVEHIRINRIGHTQFGTPPWARTLRFYSAMNQLTEAHVSMAQAASTFIAKRVMKGGPEGVTRSANAILAMTGEIGAARFGEDPEEDELTRGHHRHRYPPPPESGSFWLENESDRLEALNMNSGASQAMQTAQIVRAPIAATSGFGQHYLGDASSANLATATSLELPTLMTVQAWQETHNQMFGWFTDLAIQSKVRSGQLGAAAGEPRTNKTLAELVIAESADLREAEHRTGKDLSYEFSMPYPGRRNLPDVTTLVTTVKSAFDATGTNVPLQRALLLFLAQHGLQVDNPKDWVDEVLPEEAGDAVALNALHGILSQAQAKAAAEQQAAAGGIPGQPSQGDPSVSPQNGELPKNAPVSALGESIAGLFSDEVMEPLMALLNRNGSAN